MFENNFPKNLEISQIVEAECKEAIINLQEENYALKNKLAVSQDILRRYKLNDVTELLKELVFFYIERLTKLYKYIQRKC